MNAYKTEKLDPEGDTLAIDIGGGTTNYCVMTPNSDVLTRRSIPKVGGVSLANDIINSDLMQSYAKRDNVAFKVAKMMDAIADGSLTYGRKYDFSSVFPGLLENWFNGLMDSITTAANDYLADVTNIMLIGGCANLVRHKLSAKPGFYIPVDPIYQILLHCWLYEMQVRLAPSVTAKVEGIRIALNYSKLSDTVNLLLDAIKHQWKLNLAYQPQTGTVKPKVRLDERHVEWVSQYATERGINATSATNLLISEYLTGNSVNFSPQPPTTVAKDSNSIPQQSKQEPDVEKPKGQALVRVLSYESNARSPRRKAFTKG
ncbi:hypothetical protein [Nostoc sp. MS1]|uniref:hypothetical protein n=1 Tax=Nostoc sp. MS1 TaxID=2764711 RepID=UPI00308D1806|nr:hypothetical protein NSMS1_67140 [Nostoc sp. MS1]